MSLNEWLILNLLTRSIYGQDTMKERLLSARYPWRRSRRFFALSLQFWILIKIQESRKLTFCLALAVRLRAEDKDARIVTEETKDIPRKMSLRTAAGLLGVPSVPLKAFLHFEEII